MRFGEFVLHLRSGELAQNGTRVVLPEQLFRVLALLVRQPGMLVTREELRHELWHHVRRFRARDQRCRQAPA